MIDPFVGMIGMFGFNFAPRDWALCNGQLLPIRQNTALFSLLGTIYGGDGKTTFALPNLMGRAPVGATSQGPGLSAYMLGEITGSETTALWSVHLPAHTHTLHAITDPGDTESPAGTYPANTGKLDKEYRTSGTTVQMQQDMVGPVGSNTPFSVQQPYLAINYCIALYGVFPPRP